MWVCLSVAERVMGLWFSCMFVLEIIFSNNVLILKLENEDVMQCFSGSIQKSYLAKTLT